jgi:hypothetical protein
MPIFMGGFQGTVQVLASDAQLNSYPSHYCRLLLAWSRIKEKKILEEGEKGELLDRLCRDGRIWLHAGWSRA